MKLIYIRNVLGITFVLTGSTLASGYSDADYWKSEDIFKKNIITKDAYNGLTKDIKDISDNLKDKKKEINNEKIRTDLVSAYARADLLSEKTKENQIHDTRGEELTGSIHSLMTKFIMRSNNHDKMADLIQEANREKEKLKTNRS